MPAASISLRTDLAPLDINFSASNASMIAFALSKFTYRLPTIALAHAGAAAGGGGGGVS